MRKLGREAIIVQADIKSWDQIKAMIETAWTKTGGIDVLMNNVGDIATDQKDWREIDEKIIDRVLAVDIKGTMLMIHEMGTRMLERGEGNIVNIASTVVVRGSPRAPQYAAGKYGIIGLTKSYAYAFAPTVRVNAFGPGFMETEAILTRHDWNNGRKERVLCANPDGAGSRPRGTRCRGAVSRNRRCGAHDREFHHVRRRLQHDRRLGAIRR